ncbi:MAG TPA: hypothetical protein VGM67_02760 [Gemmatimonadaceae bacterium]|jgi:hypothetical protein
MSFVHHFPILSIVGAFVVGQIVLLGVLGMCSAAKRGDELAATLVANRRVGALRQELHAKGA